MKSETERTYPLEVRMFGSFEVVILGAGMPRLRTRKGYVLLAHLILRAPKEISRERLCETLWPESGIEQARLSLRQALADLRKCLGEAAGRICSPTPQTVFFDPEDCFVDVFRFDEIACKADQDVALLDEAISLYRGPLLEAYFDGALSTEREVRDEAVTNILFRRAEIAAGIGDVDTQVRCLRRAVSIDRTNERAVRNLMSALGHDGDRAGAVEAYDTLVRNLGRIGLRPSDKTRELFRTIQTTGVTFPADLPEGRFPLFGREDDLKRLSDAISRYRLVTISGLGGIGKSRLLDEVTDLLAAEQSFGVLHKHSLEGQSNNTCLAETAARSLGIQLRTGTAEQLAEAIGARALVFAFDACEMALDECREFVAALLRECRSVRFLIASREPLGLRDEAVIQVMPLSTSGEQGHASPASSMFMARVRRVCPAFEPGPQERSTIDEICCALDGIPLALELAAARTRTMSLAEINRRLDRRFELLKSSERDRTPRHQTLERTIRDSVDLLGDEIRHVLLNLSVFSGGFTLEAAERVVEDDGTTDAIGELVNLSLVRIQRLPNGESRYSLLDTIRLFALSELKASGGYETARRRHFDEFLRMAKAANDELLGSEQVRWLEVLDLELSNCRAALTAENDDTRFCDLVQFLVLYWHLRATTAEAKRWIDAAVARCAGLPSEIQARVYVGASIVAWHRSAFLEGLREAEVGLELARAAGDPKCVAYALNALGILCRALGDVRRSLEVAQEAVEIARVGADTARLARNLANYARALGAAGETGAAIDAFRESLAAFREVGDDRDYAHSEQSLAWVLSENGYFEQALYHYLESVQLLAGLGDHYRLAYSLSGLSSLMYRTEDYQSAAKLLGIVQEWQRRFGFEVISRGSARLQEEVTAFRARLGPQFEELLAEGARMDLEAAVAHVRKLEVSPLLMGATHPSGS